MRPPEFRLAEKPAWLCVEIEPGEPGRENERAAEREKRKPGDATILASEHRYDWYP